MLYYGETHLLVGHSLEILEYLNYNRNHDDKFQLEIIPIQKYSVLIFKSKIN